MALLENKKDPNIVSPINVDVESSVDNREVIKLLPGVNQTQPLEKFFSSTFDHLFQPSKVKKFSGYVGQRPSYWKQDSEFYLAEPTTSREAYQLEPTMVSKTDDNITHTLFYEDIVNHLRFQGGLTDSHSRMFDQEYYSWCPPIDLDKLTAFTNYFWLPEGPDAIHITEPTDIDNDIRGKLQYTFPVSGLTLTSGLRLVFENDVNAIYNGVIFGVEAVGRGILLLDNREDAAETCPWDHCNWDEEAWEVTVGASSSGVEQKPDYMVMERGARDKNPWSTSNRWYHRDVVELSGTAILTDISNLQATKPIVEFERDIELYGYGDGVAQIVDVIYTETDDFYNALDTRDIWNVTVPLDDPGNKIGLFYGQYGIAGEMVGSVPTALLIDGVSIRDGMTVLVTNDVNSGVNHKIYQVQGIQTTGKIILVPVYTSLPNVGDQYRVRYGVNFEDSYVRFNGNGWDKAQEKLSLNQPPLFQLYDVDTNRLDDIGVYPDSTFAGNKIFSYQPSTNPLQPVDDDLDMQVTYNEYGDIVYDNNMVKERYSYEQGIEIPGFYMYRQKGATEADDNYINCWYQIEELSKQYIVDEFITEAGQTEFTLTTTPDASVTGELPTVIVDRSGERMVLNTDFTVSGNIITIPNATEGDFYIVKSFEKSFRPAEGQEVHYEIPVNLQGNPDNLEVEEVTNSSYFHHFRDILENQENFEGDAYGKNNWRDTAMKRSFGRTILQHRASLLKLMLLASTEDLDLMLAVRFAEREYNRFKNKYIQLVNTYVNDITKNSLTASNWFDNALKQINLGKPETFPFYNSGCGGLHTFIPPTASFLGVAKTYKPEFYYDTSFETPAWVIRGHDNSQFIMYGEHDGTEFTDKRDEAILEFEQRIYDTIPDSYKGGNLIDYLQPEFLIGELFPGKFRTTDYTREEVNKLSRPMFERWAASKGIDYRTNNTYEQSNKFTWNYSTASDIDGERVPGNWRGIYKWYFDTDRPNTHPWEMLGFSEKPDYWDARYGNAPYTGANQLMWDDLEQGYIADGVRAGTSVHYARPGLSKIIPVDSTGELLDPFTARIVPNLIPEPQASAAWEFGDMGPIENVWAKTEFYGFAYAQIAYLMKPARFVELGWDADNWEYIFPNTTTFQWTNTRTRNRPQHNQLSVHGEVQDDGTTYIGSGIDQWISDWVVSRGQDVTETFGTAIRGLDSMLGNKIGGFLDSANLKAQADNFGLLPSEDVLVNSYLSKSVQEHSYSGVLIEWTGSNFAVYGYDAINPNFRTIPGNDYGPTVKISVGEDAPTVTEHWNTNTAYAADHMIVYQAYLYKATVDHTSTEIFDRENWTFIGAQVSNNGISVSEQTLPNTEGITVDIPYGTTFATQQDVFNFLIDYNRWLELEGWVFDDYREDTSEHSTWRASGKEFLAWSIDTREAGDFIALSPAGLQVKFEAEHGAIQSVEQIVNGVYALLDRTGQRILPRDTDVSRNDQTLTITPNDEDIGIYSARIYLKELEHIVLFNNTTIFNDLVYDPLFNTRQPRLKLIGVKTRNWDGRLTAPGFIVETEFDEFNAIDSDIYTNFEKTASDFEHMYDIENSVDNPVLRDHARHITGYQTRDYLDSLLPDSDVQFQFYQGMIQQKGAPDSMDKLLRVQGIAGDQTLNIFEEWAFRLGRFGATEIRPSIELQLDRSEIRNNPQLIQFGTQGPENIGKDLQFDDTIHVMQDDVRWLRKPQDPTQQNVFALRNHYGDVELDYPSAGYVKLDEVDYTSFTRTDLDTVYSQALVDNNPFEVGKTLWVYDDGLGEFIVYKMVDTGAQLQHVADGVNTTITLTSAIDVADDDYIVIAGASKSIPNLEGVKQVTTQYSVTGSTANPTTIGESININGTVIELTGTTVDEAVADITAVEIPGITASNINGNLRITGTSPLTLNAGVASETLTSPIIDNGDSFFVNGSEVIIDGNPDNVGNIANAVFNTGDQLVINGRTIILDASTANDISEAANQINAEMTTAGIDVVASVDAIGTDDFLKLVSLTTIIDVTSDNTFGLKQTVQGRSDPSLATDLQVIADAITNQSSATATVDGTDVIITSATLTLAPGTSTPDLLAKVNLVSGTFISAWDDFGITTGLHTTVESLNIAQQTDTAFDWSTDQSNAPQILKLENTRFATITERDASTLVWATNDLCYVDDVNGQWTTYIYNGTSWDTHRTEEYRLENRNIINAIIYDKRENKITQHLDIHDPRKGIVAQHAEKELWYKLEYDPAIYTNGDIEQHNIIARKAWGPEEVGRVWWDLSTAKYLEYEMGSDEYRIANWGQLAPGSSVDVYEWVRSSTPPAEWVDNLGKPISEGRTSNDRYSGEVKGASEENIAWVERAEWNAKTNSTKTYYYYWVKNVETVPGVPFRKNSAATVARFIENPTREGLLWFAPISKASFIVSNVYPFLVDEDTVIQINWNSGDADVNVHTQWELMREGDQNSQPDDLLWNKMQDSLSAIDAEGNTVPDSTLSEVEVLGTSFRPRQTWFNRLDEARTIFTTKVNDILATDAVVNNRIGWDNLLFDTEALPEASTYDFSVSSFSERDQLVEDNLIVTGQKVFIEPTAEYGGRWVVQEFTNTVTELWTDFNTQDYKVEDYWDYVDYWADGYSETSTIVETYTDATSRAVAMVAGTTFDSGDLVKLTDDGNGLWVIEVYDATENTWAIVAAENGTIEISSTFNISTATYPAQELRTIINALQVNILTKLEINELFFTMINYVHSEQSMVDWAFKTSYLYMTGLEEKIGQSVIQKTDQTEFVINYIEEVKPYHCKIRDFVQGKSLQVEEANVHATDFDKPMYYDPNTEEYRLLDPTNATDLNILETTAPFTDWYENWQAGNDNVRKIKSTIYYDRVKCWTDVPINGSNLECMKIASNIVTSPETTKSLTLFSNLNSTATLQGFKIRVAPTGTVIYTGDDNTVSFETPQILTQLESLTVTKNSVVIYENGVALTTNPDDVFEVNGVGTAIIFTVPVATGESLEITVDENYNGTTPATITVTEGANEIISTTVIPTSTSTTEGLVNVALTDAITYDTDFKVTIDTGGATAGLVYVEMVYNLSVELAKFDSTILDAADRIALFYNPAPGMPKKELTLLNNNCRIKGSTIYSNDLEDDGVYRSKYTVKPLDGCDFRGTIIEGGNLLGTDTQDLLLKDGYDDFQTASFQGKGENTWDTNEWDTEPYEEATNNEYELPWFADNPASVGVTVDNITYTNGVEFTIPASPGNKLIFNPGFVPVFGAYIFVSDGQTFIESPTGASDTIVEGNTLAQPHWAEDHPEELAKIKPSSSANISVFYSGSTGSPTVYTDRAISDGVKKEYGLFVTPQSNHSVFIYVDGLLQELNVDYVIDWEARLIRFEVGGVSTTPATGAHISITMFGAGGHNIVEQQYVAGKATYELREPNIKQNIVIAIDGEYTSAFTVDGNIITFDAGQEPLTTQMVTINVVNPGILERYNFATPTSSVYTLTSQPTSDTQIMVLLDNVAEAFTYNPATFELTITSGIPTGTLRIVVFNESDISIVETERFSATLSGQEIFTISNTPNSTRPDNSAVFVYKNGLRLTQQETQYINAKTIQRVYDTPNVIANPSSTMKLWSQWNDNAMLTYGIDYVVPETFRGEMFSEGITIEDNLTNLGLTIGDLNPGDFFLVFGPSHTNASANRDFDDSWNVNNPAYPNDATFPNITMIVWSGTWWSLTSQIPYVEVLDATSTAVDTLPYSNWNTGVYTVNLLNEQQLKQEIHFAEAFASDVEYIVYTTGVQGEFDIENNQLVVYSVEPGDEIAITTLTEDATYRVQTQVFDQTFNGQYRLSQLPYDESYIWVTINGERVSFMRDYHIETSEEGWDEMPWDEQGDVTNIDQNNNLIPGVGEANQGWDVGVPFAVVQLPAFSINQPIDKTIVPQESNRHNIEVSTWGTPEWGGVWAIDGYKIVPPLPQDDNILDAWNSKTDKYTVQVTTMAGPPAVPNFAYRMFQDNFENDWVVERISDEYKTTLRVDYNEGDTTISVDTNPNVPENFIPNDLFINPSTTKGGVIWIEGERIEYWSLDRFTDGASGRTWYQLGNLVTETKGTSSRTRLMEDQETTSNGRAKNYPLGTTVTTTGDMQMLNGLYPGATPDTRVGNEAIQMRSVTLDYTGNGSITEFGTTYNTFRTITSVYEVQGTDIVPIINTPDNIRYTTEHNKIIFTTPVGVGTDIKIVQVLPTEFDLVTKVPQAVEFLRASPGSYENK